MVLQFDGAFRCQNARQKAQHAAPHATLPPRVGSPGHAQVAVHTPLALPPLGAALPPIGAGGAADGAADGADDASIDVALHVAPIMSVPKPPNATYGLYPEQPFGCDSWVWCAELSVIALGGAGLEQHVTLPLAPAEHGAPPAPLRLGRYELRVRRCVGHHVRPAGADAAQAALARGASQGRGASSALLVSDYPLLLLHAEVAIRALDEPHADGAGAAVHTAADGREDTARAPLAPVARSETPKEKAKSARRREAEELGDAIERMLGL